MQHRGFRASLRTVFAAALVVTAIGCSAQRRESEEGRFWDFFWGGADKTVDAVLAKELSNDESDDSGYTEDPYGGDESGDGDSGYTEDDASVDDEPADDDSEYMEDDSYVSDEPGGDGDSGDTADDSSADVESADTGESDDAGGRGTRIPLVHRKNLSVHRPSPESPSVSNSQQSAQQAERAAKRARQKLETFKRLKGKETVRRVNFNQPQRSVAKKPPPPRRNFKLK